MLPKNVWTFTVEPRVALSDPYLDEAARKVVEAVLRKGDCFDWNQHSDEIRSILIVYRAMAHSEMREVEARMFTQIDRKAALEDARKAISFEALRPRPMMPKSPSEERPLYWSEKTVAGHCVHRAKSILAKMIRGLEG
jgi:hypothetical protein